MKEKVLQVTSRWPATLLWVCVCLGFWPASAKAQVIYDNNKLRFGTGFEASVNANGNLQQPFYYNAAQRAWRKLTFSAYSLENAIGIGGDKANEWNTNGTIVLNPTLSNQVIDTSGFVVTSEATGTRGYGTVVSRGNIAIDGHMLEVKNTYQLPKNSAYIQITTQLRNLGPAALENVRLWTGTRDDWVGTTDVPAKIKGNIVDGAFVPVTSADQRAAALQIASGAEGVFFFTDTPKANMIIQACCDFNNIIRHSPQTSLVAPTSDAAYGFYVRLNDLAAGASDAFTWYYAAGELPQLPEIVVDVAAASGGFSSIAYTTATFTATSKEDAAGYWMVVASNAARPTADQVRAGTAYGPAVVASGSGTMQAQEARAFYLGGLTAGTAYDFYFVTENAVGGASSIRRIPFATKAYSKPAVSTSAQSGLGQTGALSGGTVTDDGGSAVTSRGICWSLSGYPTTANSKTTDGTGTGPFTSTLAGLMPNTTYFVRAYATNAAGTAYGNLIALRTSPADPVSLTSPADTICAGSSTQLTVNGVQGLVYWYAAGCGGTAIGTGNTLVVSPALTTTYYARNYNGSFSGCAAITVVVDQEAPVAAGHDVTVNLGADLTALVSVADVDNGSRDACGPVSLALTSGKTAYDCFDIGKTYPLVLTAVDQQGNADSVTVWVTVADPQSHCNQAPMAVAKPLILAAGANCLGAAAAADFDGGSRDADGDRMTFTAYPAGPYALGTTAVRFTVRDPAGASDTMLTTITVVDEASPVARAQNVMVELNDQGQAVVTAAQVNNGSTDNCGIASLQLSQTSFDCSGIGANPVTLTVRDQAGNEAVASATVTVVGALPEAAIRVLAGPTGHGQDSLTIYLGYGAQSVVLDASSETDEGVSFAWTGDGILSSYTGGKPVFAPQAPGAYTFSVLKTNRFGCSASSAVTLRVVDVRCGNKNDKVIMCHKGREICIARPAVAAHLAHGDKIGPCAAPVSSNARFAFEVSQETVTGLVAFPNPGKEKTMIEFTMIAAGQYQLALYDQKGALVKQLAAGKAASNQFFSYELDVRDYPVGVYLLRLSTAQETVTRRLVIER